MSRKHKTGWEEMATNVVMISLKKVGKALNIKCDFQEIQSPPSNPLPHPASKNPAASFAAGNENY